MAVMRLGVGVAFYDAINVKYQGAAGDGTTDDTAAIQASLDLAFGSSASPHGNSAYLNKPVYFPAGQYKITSPLLVTQVKSGKIFGDGSQVSTITYSGGVYPGNSVANAENTITPILMTNGFAYASIENLGFSIPDSSGLTCCIYLFGNFSSSPILIKECLFQNASAGIQAGYLSPNNVSEVLYQSCNFANLKKYGIRVVGQNTLNHEILRCSFANDGNGGYGTNSAAISCATGSIPTIIGCDFAQCLLDVYSSGTNPLEIIGCRTESASFVQGDGGSTIVNIRGCVQSATTPPGTFLTLTGSACGMIDGCDPINSVLVTAGNSDLFIKNLLRIPSGFFTASNARMWEYDQKAGGTTVATLPTASTAFRGIRLFVTDSNIAASGNFATDISGHGGGSTVVPVWCSGAAWLIG